MVDNRRECAEFGCVNAAEFIDVDRSASRHAKRTRDDFEAMIKGIEAGECDILFTWEASRFHRDLEVYLRLRNVCMAAGVLWCYNGTVYDLSKRSDRRATAMDAIQAEDEAEGIRDRNIRTKRLLSERGAPAGRILYGYARRYDASTGDLVEQYPHPERAEIVREFFTRIAAGESKYAIVRDLNARGLSRYGHPWQEHHAYAMLLNPGYIGRRIHRGVDVGKATWAPIVDEETFYAVQAIVRDPKRRSTKERAVQHLLSGIVTCGVCGSVLRVANNRSYLSYMCRGDFCVSMREDKLDAYVEQAVIDWLGSERAIAAFQGSPGNSGTGAARAKQAALEAQLTEARTLAGTVRNGVPALSIMSLAALEAQLAPQIKEARQQAEAAGVPPVVRNLLGRPDVEAAWATYTLTQKRMVLRKILQPKLNQARSIGVRRIEPGRISLDFVGSPGFTTGG
jgi:DNA invertase Pin-like site-specific DNA recombinase